MHAPASQAVSAAGAMSASFLLLVSITVFGYATLVIIGEDGTAGDWTKQVTFFALIWILSYVIASKIFYKSFYLLTTAFLTLLILFHLGFTIPVGLGFLKEDVSRYISAGAWKASYWNQQAGWYTLVALGCFGCGFSFGLLRGKRDSDTASVEVANQTLDFAYWMGIGLFVASAIMFAHAVASLGNVLQYSRFDLIKGVGGDIRSFGAFLIFYPAAVTLLVIGARTRVRRWMALSLAAVSFGVLLLQGDRSIAMLPVLVGAIVWVKVGRRIPAVLAVGGVAFVLIAIPAVGMLREMTYDKMDQESIRDSVQDTTFAQTFAIMGQTGGGLGHILRLVPKKYPYRYGSTYLNALQSVVPNVGLSSSRGSRGEMRAKNLVSAATVGELSPDHWLSYELLGRQAFLMGHGTGFSIVGEPYMNFGLPGVVGFFFVVGYLLSRLDGINLLARPKTLIFACTMFPAFVFVTRNEFSTFLKPSAFLLITMLIWYFGTRMIGKGPRPTQ